MCTMTLIAALVRAGSVLGVLAAGQAVSRKRGFSGFQGNYYTCQDAAALGLDDSWSYTWTANTNQQDKCGKQSLTAEFVPMINGVQMAQSFQVTNRYKSEWTAANVRFLLGYNEPDFGNGHNHPHMATPAAAAAAWPLVQQIAAQFDPPLILVAPSISSGSESGGADAWDADGKSTWLDEFFANCTSVVKECKPWLIKYIAMHDYQGDVTKLKRRVSGAVKRYGGRKLWMTEIAITKYGDPPSRAEQNTFMRTLLPYLDGSDDVFRYAWFSARNAPNQQNGGSNLLPYDSRDTTPTSTGKIYAQPEVRILFE